MGIQITTQPQTFKSASTVMGATAGLSAVDGLTVYGSISASGTIYGTGVAPVLNTASGNGSTTSFAINGFTNTTPQNYLVVVGGLVQRPSTDYTASGGSILFTTAPPNGAQILILAYQSLPGTANNTTIQVGTNGGATSTISTMDFDNGLSARVVGSTVDVRLPSGTAGQVLTYNGSTDVWVASAAPSGGTSSSLYVNSLPETYRYGGGWYAYDSFGFIDSDGVARVIGWNSYNRFGPSHVYGLTFGTMPLPAGELASKLYIGVNNCAVITTAGKLYMTGRNSEGQCGVGNTTSPVQTLTACNLPSNVSTFIQTNEVSNSGNTIYALTTDGKLYAWGYNQYGSVGDGTVVQKTTPVLVLGPGNTYGNPTTTVTQVISLGGADGANEPISTAALLSDGTVWCVGYGGVGQMGNGTTTAINNKFVQVTGLTGITKIGGVGYDALISFYALKSNGALYGWGYNAAGNLGDNTTVNKTSPVQMLTTNMANTTVVDIWPCNGATMLSIFVRTVDGAIYACGSNGNGQLGLGDTTQRNILTRVTSLNNTNVYDFAYDHGYNASSVFAICSGTQQLYSTGHNGQGQLGTGDSTDRNTFTPVRFYNSSGIKTVAKASTFGVGGFTVVLTNDNKIYGTGQSRYGRFTSTDANQYFFRQIGGWC